MRGRSVAFRRFCSRSAPGSGRFVRRHRHCRVKKAFRFPSIGGGDQACGKRGSLTWDNCRRKQPIAGIRASERSPAVYCRMLISETRIRKRDLKSRRNEQAQSGDEYQTYRLRHSAVDHCQVNTQCSLLRSFLREATELQQKKPYPSENLFAHGIIVHLPCHPSSIHRKDLTSHVGRRFASEKDNRTHEILRVTPSPCGDSRQYRSCSIRVLN